MYRGIQASSHLHEVTQGNSQVIQDNSLVTQGNNHLRAVTQDNNHLRAVTQGKVDIQVNSNNQVCSPNNISLFNHTLHQGGCPPGVDPTLYSWFVAVDTDHSGAISTTELQQALTNGNWSHFNPETCRLMIGLKKNCVQNIFDQKFFSQVFLTKTIVEQ